MVCQANSLRGAKCRGVRVGSTIFFVIAALAVVTVVGAVSFSVWRGRAKQVVDVPLTDVVKRGPYKHEVLEQGEVESANNQEIRCEVRARNASGPSTSIIDIIPEGTHVKKGDWLITFDSSTLELERSQQRILVNTSEALVIQAKALYETSLIAKKEYLEGTYKEQEKTILNSIFVAEETLKKAQLSHDSIKRLVSRGLLNPLQLEGEQFRVDAARNDLDLAKRKLEVLEKYTQQKMLTQLESDIQSAEVKWRNEQSNHQEELKKLRDVEDQISKCRVLAPQDGQVVYANIQSSRSASEFVVEPGAMVRERQTVLRLPDPTSMQVKAKIAESKINLIHEGLPVSIRIDAFGEDTLTGTITKVNKYAEAGNWWNSTAKEYATFVRINNPPPTLRVGLTAEVRVHVESRPNAVLIPVQAVYERFGRTFCLVANGTGWDTREVFISSTNDKIVAVDETKPEAVREGDQIVLNPRRHVDLFDPSKLPQQPPEDRPQPEQPVAQLASEGTRSPEKGPAESEAPASDKVDSADNTPVTSTAQTKGDGS